MGRHRVADGDLIRWRLAAAQEGARGISLVIAIPPPCLPTNPSLAYPQRSSPPLPFFFLLVPLPFPPPTPFLSVPLRPIHSLSFPHPFPFLSYPLLPIPFPPPLPCPFPIPALPGNSPGRLLAANFPGRFGQFGKTPPLLGLLAGRAFSPIYQV